MLSSSKIALFLGVFSLTVPACALVLGDFEPAGTGGSGGTASTAVQSSAAASVGGAGGTLGVTATAGTGGAMATSGSSSSAGGNGGGMSSSSASSGSSSTSTSASSSSSGGGGCSGDNDCTALNNACQTGICVDFMCKPLYAPVGTAPPAAQTPGNCQKNICDGVGGLASVNDDTDKPLPSNPCQVGGCSLGMPVFMNAVNSTPCPGGTCTQGSCSPFDGGGPSMDGGVGLDGGVIPSLDWTQ